MTQHDEASIITHHASRITHHASRITHHASRHDSTHERITEYDTLRAVLTILVVVGHCTYYSIVTKYGGVDFGGMMAANGVSDSFAHKLFSLISGAIYSFHMPLFMALSGALFSRSAKTKFHELLRVKSQRLLIPFLVVTSFVSVPLKYLAGYWDESRNILRDIFIGQYLIQGNSHLWFLATLFCLMVLFWFIINCFSEKKLRPYIFLCLVAANMCVRFVGVAIIWNMMTHALWFYAGYVFSEYREECNRRITARKCAVFFVVWLVLFLLGRFMPHDAMAVKIARKIVVFIACWFGMICCYSLCFLLRNSRLSNNRISQSILNDSLGIYLYSDTFNYNILYIFVSAFGIESLSSNVAATWLYILRLSLTFGLSVIITRILKKNHVRFIA